MNKTMLVESFFKGQCLQAYHIFGSHITDHGVIFTVFAPNARQVLLIGDFNDWQGESMTKIHDRGIWQITVPAASQYDLYKYRIETANYEWIEKVDPYAHFSEMRPSFCSKIYDLSGFPWMDDSWMSTRQRNLKKPLHIYEVHLGSWRRKSNNDWYSYEEIASELVNYVKSMGYTHIELMPLTEYPFDGSWGYQSTGYFSATSRYGNPKQLMHLIDLCHRNDIGVILDFVPIHFVKDSHGLSEFDGGYVYEYKQEHDRYSEWGTLNFDLHEDTVRSFLMSSVHFWLTYYHIDGIRMDAISNLIYWGGNKDRGVNFGAIYFIQQLNMLIHQSFDSVMLIAEDSTDYPNVTKPVQQGGLGFDYKWDLGWMNDTLKYFQRDPIYRKHHHHDLTFSMAYYQSEQFLLPLSHDEVVHGKGTIINKLWGNYEQKFAQLRLLYTYMITHPGKKLNFMGNELAQFREWSEDVSLDWMLLGNSKHAAFNRFFRDLNRIYKSHPAFSELDHEGNSGFQWIDADNMDQSIYSYYRFDESGKIFVVILNMTPSSYDHYWIGVPKPGRYVELINSEKDIYEGCNMCNYYPRESFDQKLHRQNQVIDISLAPFAGIIFECYPFEEKSKAIKQNNKAN